MGFVIVSFFYSSLLTLEIRNLVFFLRNSHLILVLPEDISIIVPLFYKKHLASTRPGFVWGLSSPFCCHHTQRKTSAIRDLWEDVTL